METTASGYYSHAQNFNTIATRKSQTALGEYNIEDTYGVDPMRRGEYVVIIGNGTSSSARSNALTGDWNGNITIDKNGGIYYKGTKSTYRMIRFIDNTADTYGNGISIGGGGLAVLGSGESADTLLTNLSLTASGGTETTYITSDGSILFYPTINSWDAAGAITMTAGRLWVGVYNNTTRENQLGVQSGAGQIYMWSGAATNANRGIYLPAHGTGAEKAAMIVDTNNNVTFNGTLNGNATSATKATQDGNGANIASTYLKLAGGTMTGLLKITANSNTVTIGSANSSWCHFSNSANIPFYFNKSIGLSGSIGTSSYPATSVYVSGSVLGNSSRSLINNSTSGQCHVGNSSDNLYLYGLSSGSGSTLYTSSNRIYYSSSSKRFKHDIQKVTDKRLDPKKLYDIEVSQFMYNDDCLDKDDVHYNKTIIGLIAEDVYEKYPVAAVISDGEVQDWCERYIIPPMLALIQDLHREIEELKTERR